VPFDRATVPLPDHDPAKLAKGLDELAWVCGWAGDPHSRIISAPRGRWGACERVLVRPAGMVRRLWHQGGYQPSIAATGRIGETARGACWLRAASPGGLVQCVRALALVLITAEIQVAEASSLNEIAAGLNTKGFLTAPDTGRSTRLVNHGLEQTTFTAFTARFGMLRALADFHRWQRLPRSGPLGYEPRTRSSSP
jgi:hypothetical protein